EGVNRLTMCTTCIINPDGTIRSYRVEPAVINSSHRLTYKEADYIHFGENAKGDKSDHRGLIAKTIDVKDSLDCLYEVSDILFQSRMKRGSLDIDEKEFEFRLSEDGREVLDYSLAHNEAYTKVIEETAIITNEIWGEIAKKLGIPFDYRNHEMIDDDELCRKLQMDLKRFNINLPKHYDGKNLQKIINSVKGKRIEDYVVRNLLSSMKPATYSSENYGHVGLGIRSENNPEQENIDTMLRLDEARTRYFKETGLHYGIAFDGDISHSAYGHTTSPIRRASDLVNQTQFMSLIMDNTILFSNQQIDDLSVYFNYNERNAKMAECDYNDMLFALWASKNIGKKFENCYISNLGERSAIVMTNEGLKFTMPYSSLNFERKYLKIGKELKSVTISGASLYPPKIIVIPTPINEIHNTNSQNSEMDTDN
ncbi:MAG: RNB domain-containing ribonuclease, partial [Christensenellales bacterium]